jgi:acetylglutamate kinase
MRITDKEDLELIYTALTEYAKTIDTDLNSSNLKVISLILSKPARIESLLKKVLKHLSKKRET